MELSEQKTRFLAKRERLVAMWGYVGVALLVGLAGTGGLIFWHAPLLADHVSGVFAACFGDRASRFRRFRQ